jgi:hypothetical protein
MIDGITQTLSAANTIYNVNAGAAAKFYGESGEISKINSLKPTGSKLKSFTSTELIVDDSVGLYPISANVVVYSKATGSYKLSTLSEAIAAYQNKTSVSFYYDKEPSRGGCIRVIVHN